MIDRTDAKTLPPAIEARVAQLVRTEWSEHDAGVRIGASAVITFVGGAYRDEAERECETIREAIRSIVRAAEAEAAYSAVLAVADAHRTAGWTTAADELVAVAGRVRSKLLARVT